MAEAEADRDLERKPPLLVFVHIPKTAGTTLSAVLRMNAGVQGIRRIGNVFKGSGGVGKGVVYERLERDGAQRLDKVTIVRGHFPLGIRDHLPADRELRCFTFLREPVDRMLSHFYSIRGNSGQRQRIKNPLAADASLEDALSAGYVHDNLHTRMLCGLSQPFGQVTDEMLEQAKRNLSHGLAVFGLTERFDESLVLAGLRLGLEGVIYRSDGRVNSGRPRGDDVPDALVRSAKRCNRYDIELYRHAQEVFEAYPEHGTLELELELATLQAAKPQGDLDLDAPAPAGFGGDEETWRMLLRSNATQLRLRWELSRRSMPSVPATVQAEALAEELAAERARTKALEQEVARLGPAAAKARKLERELEKLRSSRPRPKREAKRARKAARARPEQARERGPAEAGERGG